MVKKQKFYAYSVRGKAGVAGSWAECDKLVSGVPNARFKGFSTRQEAQRWLSEGADYGIKHIAAEKGIYFDAGTGGGNGVEINVTDEKGKSFARKLLSGDVTNNFGELLACKTALEKAKEKKEKKIFGDSALIIEYWSKGYVNKEVSAETRKLAAEVALIRKDFERTGGKIEKISGGDNPADLGFHKD
jgi:ribonuclease H-related protein